MNAPRAEPTVALRTGWIHASDTVLLAGSEVDRYRASGPGGQHRNKTESAVRLRHAASGQVAIAEESRSQGENRERALRRLREAFMLHVRVPCPPDTVPAGVAALLAGGTARLGEKTRQTPAYHEAMAGLLDVLASTGYEVATTAAQVGVTTGALAKFLTHDPMVLKIVNQARVQRGLRPLR